MLTSSDLRRRSMAFKIGGWLLTFGIGSLVLSILPVSIIHVLLMFRRRVDADVLHVFRWLGVVLAVAAIPALAYGWYRGRIALALARTGRLTYAEITSVQDAVSFSDEPLQIVHYRYRDRSGHLWEGSSGPLEDVEAGLWKVGDRAPVRYETAHPERSVWIGHDISSDAHLRRRSGRVMAVTPVSDGAVRVRFGYHDQRHGKHDVELEMDAGVGWRVGDSGDVVFDARCPGRAVLLPRSTRASDPDEAPAAATPASSGMPAGRRPFSARDFARRVPGVRWSWKVALAFLAIVALSGFDRVFTTVVTLAWGLGLAWSWWSGRNVGRLAADLARDGVRTRATIIAIRRAAPGAPTIFGRQPVLLVRSLGHVIEYRYLDADRRGHIGDSGALDEDEIATWRVGAHGTIAYDREHPDLSVWVGRT
jgi:hypothetical protein